MRKIKKLKSKKTRTFHRYTALGNDYLVIDPGDFPGGELPSAEWIKKLCHRHLGVGSDGLLWGPIYQGSQFALRIFNPDGSEAEKSGNGIRIFSRYLLDANYLKDPLEPFSISTKGGEVKVQILNTKGSKIKVEMGQASFLNDDIGVIKSELKKESLGFDTEKFGQISNDKNNETIGEIINFEGQKFSISCLSMGNPHTVILVPKNTLRKEIAIKLGEYLENRPFFKNRTNVQLLEIIDKNNIKIEIWERGAGYTLASGSSSCAASALSYRLGLVENKVNVHMPGGIINIELEGKKEHPHVVMEGGVDKICTGILDESWSA
jgi:diaminopimelate epimerase